ncbi:type II toxin-antitoxin system RelE/ParE family toxin [Salinicola salarius]|jgi:addiction module RelE/StbE family toxin|uniref:type II toxin-antitoxin system RelE/ParE family toxin n=1 Tax=Salinicola salarius TaxID=430457 RepID=UPI001C4F5C67|nr:type II toxin-antitoxin system RelE/ParE family toxin [Salinicola salarius]MDF3917844.1 type II toxin-antitoxin system RelE/ParE family toxin [Salinicola salarius]
MLLVEWQPQARESLLEILDYLGDHNFYAAEWLQRAIEDTVEALPQHPYLFRPGRVPGTREAVIHPNYLVVYRVAFDHIAIVEILHARQEYP